MCVTLPRVSNWAQQKESAFLINAQQRNCIPFVQIISGFVMHTSSLATAVGIDVQFRVCVCG